MCNNNRISQPRASHRAAGDLGLGDGLYVDVPVWLDNASKYFAINQTSD